MTTTEADINDFEREFTAAPEFCEILPPRHARLEETAKKLYDVLKNGDEVPFAD